MIDAFFSFFADVDLVIAHFVADPVKFPAPSKSRCSVQYRVNLFVKGTGT
jgi:hypothetical protein